MTGKRKLPVQGGSGQASEPEPAARASNSRGSQRSGANSNATRQGQRNIADQHPEPRSSKQSEDGSDWEESNVSKPKRRKTTAPKKSAPKKSAPRKTAVSITASEIPNDVNADFDDDANDEASNDGHQRNGTRGLDRSLPPIANVEEAFQDLVENKSKKALIELAKDGGFKLRVATMCSGTDSPMFALELINKAFAATDPDHRLLDIEHVFSVEYVPWKAAFIHRNTNTKVFGDVRDFGSEQNEAYVYYLTLSRSISH